MKVETVSEHFVLYCEHCWHLWAEDLKVKRLWLTEGLEEEIYFRGETPIGSPHGFECPECHVTRVRVLDVEEGASS